MFGVPESQPRRISVRTPIRSGKTGVAAVVGQTLGGIVGGPATKSRRAETARNNRSDSRLEAPLLLVQARAVSAHGKTSSGLVAAVAFRGARLITTAWVPELTSQQGE